MTKKELTIKNLKLLIKAWEGAGFHPKMREFGGIEGKNQSHLKIGLVNECGTSCCALGFAPSVKGLEIQAEDFCLLFDHEPKLDFLLYSSRIFPYLTKRAWIFLFDSDWTNNRLLFIKRAEALINSDFKVSNATFIEHGYSNVDNIGYFSF